MIHTTLEAGALGAAVFIALTGFASAAGDRPGEGVTVHPIERT